VSGENEGGEAKESGVFRECIPTKLKTAHTLNSRLLESAELDSTSLIWTPSEVTELRRWCCSVLNDRLPLGRVSAGAGGNGHSKIGRQARAGVEIPVLPTQRGICLS
jgi:hypothetical protein